jgi:hypothetical protein
MTAGLPGNLIEEDMSKSGFSSINENIYNIGEDCIKTVPKFILSPGLLIKSPMMTPLRTSDLGTRIDMSSPDFAAYANTPGGKRLKTRLNDLINTLGPSSTNMFNNKAETIISDDTAEDSFCLTSSTQPEFSSIDF